MLFYLTSLLNKNMDIFFFISISDNFFEHTIKYVLIIKRLRLIFIATDTIFLKKIQNKRRVYNIVKYLE